MWTCGAAPDVMLKQQMKADSAEKPSFSVSLGVLTSVSAFVFIESDADAERWNDERRHLEQLDIKAPKATLYRNARGNHAKNKMAFSVRVN